MDIETVVFTLIISVACVIAFLINSISNYNTVALYRCESCKEKIILMSKR